MRPSPCGACQADARVLAVAVHTDEEAVIAQDALTAVQAAVFWGTVKFET